MPYACQANASSFGVLCTCVSKYATPEEFRGMLGANRMYYTASSALPSFLYACAGEFAVLKEVLGDAGSNMGVVQSILSRISFHAFP
jgi:hypothetical protein